jgi:hypothetical protein
MLNCEGIISKDECVSAIRTFKNGKSPGTDGSFSGFGSSVIILCLCEIDVSLRS